MEKLNVELKVLYVNGGSFVTSKDDDSGYDITAIGYARVVDEVVQNDIILEDGESFIVHPHETVKIKTGVHLGIPTKVDLGSYYEIMESQIRPRSGLSLKEHSNVKLGTGDNNYIGELCAIFVNDGTEDLVIKKYERIAQIVISKIVKFKDSNIRYVNSLEELGESTRGSNGFGSTGK